jgi:hypothetical protein
LSTLHLSLAFNQAHSDHSKLTNITTYSYTILLIHAADIVQVEDHLSELSRIKSILDNNFGIKYLAILKFFLGLDVAHSPKGISICQIQHCLTLLSVLGVLCSKPVSTAMEPSFHLHHNDGALFNDIDITFI